MVCCYPFFFAVYLTQQIHVAQVNPRLASVYVFITGSDPHVSANTAE